MDFYTPRIQTALNIHSLQIIHLVTYMHLISFVSEVYCILTINKFLKLIDTTLHRQKSFSKIYHLGDKEWYGNKLLEDEHYNVHQI